MQVGQNIQLNYVDLSVETGGGRNDKWKESDGDGAEYLVELRCVSVDRGDRNNKWKEPDTGREEYPVERYFLPAKLEGRDTKKYKETHK